MLCRKRPMFGAYSDRVLSCGAADLKGRNKFSPRRGLNTPAQGRAKRRQTRSAVLGERRHKYQALKGRHNTHARSESRFALSGLRSEAILLTQGGAALCPGLICSGPFGANSAAARSGRVFFPPLQARQNSTTSPCRSKPHDRSSAIPSVFSTSILPHTNFIISRRAISSTWEMSVVATCRRRNAGLT